MLKSGDRFSKEDHARINRMAPYEQPAILSESLGELAGQRIPKRLAIRALVVDASGLRSTGVLLRLNIRASNAMNAGLVSSVARCVANAREVSWPFMSRLRSARWLVQGEEGV